ncbi:zinc/manganese transport system ATP-binding protein [Labedella gwakjiensis]|uniref:Metal ABC transporter ATP-binding protein n=1 Tax=Labedella gwakjiensis TaxID=390269 RepID=A0A2P8GX61_9MICO|nr:zinc ABC transporter ATP-binding protein AztA [Labedella gwakjiensis]PSL38544.1 zinc/manganese transport system ATP-binding protein [Labedella gwakjiensis]RUQ86946.1 metal ABC transporter ATP-binding protein [Labedella gwakjiensis]
MTSITTHSRQRAHLRGVHVDFDGRSALGGVDLDVHAGSTTVIAGPNGAGKSTLLEVLAGTRDPTSGTRSVDGAIAFVPQRTAISDRLPVTVRDVVTVGTWGRTGRWHPLGADGRAAVAEAMARLGITALATHPLASLSGGQRQRALLAQGIARGADLLLLDEPTTGLDSDSAERIRSIMRSEAERGVAVVCVSHDPVVIREADHVVRLADGVRIGE